MKRRAVSRGKGCYTIAIKSESPKRAKMSSIKRHHHTPYFIDPDIIRGLKQLKLSYSNDVFGELSVFQSESMVNYLIGKLSDMTTLIYEYDLLFDYSTDTTSAELKN